MDEDDEYEQQRIADHLAGPVAAGWAQLNAIAASDFASAWKMWTPALQSKAIDDWIAENHAVFADVMGDELLADLPRRIRTCQGQAWTSFADDQLADLQANLAPWPWMDYLAASSLGAGSSLRPVPPHYELIVYFRTTPGVITVIHHPQLLSVIAILTEPSDAGWLIAAFTQTPLT